MEEGLAVGNDKGSVYLCQLNTKDSSEQEMNIGKAVKKLKFSTCKRWLFVAEEASEAISRFSLTDARFQDHRVEFESLGFGPLRDFDVTEKYLCGGFKVGLRIWGPSSNECLFNTLLDGGAFQIYLTSWEEWEPKEDREVELLDKYWDSVHGGEFDRGEHPNWDLLGDVALEGQHITAVTLASHELRDWVVIGRKF